MVGEVNSDIFIGADESYNLHDVIHGWPLRREFFDQFNRFLPIKFEVYFWKEEEVFFCVEGHVKKTQSIFFWTTKMQLLERSITPHSPLLKMFRLFYIFSNLSIIFHTFWQFILLFWPLSALSILLHTFLIVISFCMFANILFLNSKYTL